MDIKNITVFIIAGICCAVMTFVIACYRSRPPKMIKRFEYALISGMGCFSLCWGGVKYFPEYFSLWDSVPFAFLVGFLGIGNVVDVIAKKYGFKIEDQTNEKN